MNVRRFRHPISLSLIAAALLAMGCSSGGSEDPSPTRAGEPTTAATAQATATTAPAATATPTATARPVTFDAAKLPPTLMSAERVTMLLGAGFRTLRDKATDPELPFSSVPTMGATLTAQRVSLVYNSFQAGVAPAAGRPFAAQDTVQGYLSAANAVAAYTALRTAWQGTLFQNLQPQTAPAGWAESFCQLGNFGTTGGQQQQWFVCMATNGPYVVTVSVGGFPGLDTASVGTVVRAHFEAALASLK